mmetsp:Transcript_65652/g.181288  ORF Transcript_65652/g.181288 Transcript_65652/m.181288 type:complete len:149 (+) Transcript_65652:211-657(+)
MDRHLTPDQLESLKEIFALFDYSGNGRIEAKELGTMLRALGQNPTEAEVQDVIAEVDVDGSGRLDLQEFINMMAGELRDTDVVGEAEDAFEWFDRDHDGGVSATDLAEAAADLGEDVTKGDIKEMVREADLDDDGKISKDSLKALVLT